MLQDQGRSIAGDYQLLGIRYRWFVCLFVCEQHNAKSYERIAMKFYGGVWDGNLNK